MVASPQPRYPRLLQLILELRAEGLSDPQIVDELNKIVAIAKICYGGVDPAMSTGQSLASPN